MSSNTKTFATKEEAKPALVPKLRFPEFRGSKGWRRSALESVCEVLNNRRRPITSNERTPGPYPYYGASGIVDYVGDFIFDERLLLVGEDGAKWGAFENTAFIAEGKYWVNNHAHVLKPFAANDTFLENYLTMQDLSPFVTGAAPPKLTLGKLKGIPVPLPPTPAEQQKIAECLSSVDELMAAQARKVDALKTHKKGLMQQLFPREGETQPRLRFPEFQNAPSWEVKRVDEQGSVLAGKALAVDAPGPQRPYLRTKNVLDGAIELSDVLTMPMTDAEFTRFEILDGDVLLNEGQSLELVGRASIYRGEFGQRCAMQNALLRFRAFPSTSAEFAAQHFRQCQKDGTFANVATKTTSVAHLGSSRFSALELAWPTPAEQQRIATCLSSLDALITAETQKHEALKTHKKGLMQQLFPSPEEVEG
jgi:type I restriction enzyme S subunit